MGGREGKELLSARPGALPVSLWWLPPTPPAAKACCTFAPTDILSAWGVGLSRAMRGGTS